MQIQRTLLPQWLRLPLTLLFTLALFSCQSPTPAAQPATQAAPAQGPAAAPPSAEGQTPPTGYSLTAPAAGFDALSNYHQEFTVTVLAVSAGAPYDSTQTVVRDVVGADAATQIDDTLSGRPPVNLFEARLHGYRYSQGREGQPCRAEPLDPATAPDLNPALRLPPVFAAQEAGRETLNGQPTLRYTFDQRSVPSVATEKDRATGRLWIAEDGDALLQYDLTVESEMEGSPYIRTWAYSLSPLDPGPEITLPEPCQPVPADLPSLPGTADVLLRPGFLRLSADVARAEAVRFYHEQLTANGWQALPGSTPDTADLDAPVTVLSFAQPYGDGGRLLALQLSEQDGRLQVIAQTVRTQAPIRVYEPGTAPATSMEADTAEPPAGDDGGAGVLPVDLPLYPGATVLNQAAEFLTQQTTDPAQDVVDFYTQALQAAGAALVEDTSVSGVTMQTWSLEGASFTLAVTSQGGTTLIVIAVG